MSDLAVSPSLLTPTVATPGAAGTARMRETAERFEASFLSQMLKPMFEGISTDGPFGGGEAEGQWRSFMIDEMAKQTVRHGGIGLADTVMSEMIRMQAEQSQAQTLPGATA
ncbi:rod-binding protein [Brevundimonas sp. NIBR11]|uniref:rod-binding protein n=1 Tax=Brevundimonas sp. NIBR11 TaxID=3015999 RepID=UPI0022F0115D|nr:rod-binding protein [Brevundimonas sp. NIBR11]WGM31593.1 hypothetical protein KKHFBJBL_01840 [Brevundimonas sp. NIBR11]